MNEIKKTVYYAAVAVVLLIIALFSHLGKVKPDAFIDQGELFFPDFKDPNEAAVLEVITFDKETGEAVPFKVVFKDHEWTIPSHYDYPADGRERLAKTAAAVIDIRKDDFRSDNVADHEACGVIDPLDETVTTLAGRGERVTIKDANDKILADFIIGKKVEGREGFRFVRVPGQKRVYAVRMDIDISTKFADWIKAEILEADKNKINKIILKDYSVNERTGRVVNRDVVRLAKKDGEWSIDRLPAGKKLKTGKMNELLKAIDELAIIDVRPKPEGLSADLKKAESIELSTETALSLQNKGYYFSKDGRLLSNEGEVEVFTDEGVIYTLRFGEVVYGDGRSDTRESDKPAANRYLFVTASFNEKQFAEPPKPSDTSFLQKADSLLTETDKKNRDLYNKHEEWKNKVEKGKKLVADLNDRFANWYYIISDENFKKINLKRSDLIMKK